MMGFFSTFTVFGQIQTFFCLHHLQFALFIKVQDALFEVMHLAEDQGLIKHSIVTPQ